MNIIGMCFTIVIITKRVNALSDKIFSASKSYIW